MHLFLLHALVLRLQSGTNARGVTLYQAQWKHVDWLEHVVAIENEVCLVTLYHDKIKAKREYMACDAISLKLLSTWCNYHSPKNNSAITDDMYLLPMVLPNGCFDFKRQFTHNNHKEACLGLAEWLGLPISGASKSTLGAKSVRIGNAATVGIAIKGLVLLRVCKSLEYIANLLGIQLELVGWMGAHGLIAQPRLMFMEPNFFLKSCVFLGVPGFWENSKNIQKK